MAEGFVFLVADRIIGRLASAALQPVALLSGAGDALADLHRNVSAAKAAILDAEAKRSLDARATLWLERLSDADDLLDELEAAGTKKLSVLVRYRTARRVREIKRTLDEIAGDRVRFGFEDDLAGPRTIRETHSFVPPGSVVGREGKKREIVEFLVGETETESQALAVTAIVGIGGLGKTTLAQLAYRDERVREHFEVMMWVCVGQDFSLRSLVEKIVRSVTVTGESLERFGLDLLQERLRDEVNGKRYLLVLDDVWNEDPKKWRDIQDLLKNGETGNRVILTSRSDRVANISGCGYICHLKALDEHSSWEVFKSSAFERGQEPGESKTVRIGKEIVRKCRGIPLALTTVGSTLRSNLEIDWFSFLEDEISSLAQDENDILPTLKLSYDRFPANLKHCFAYCSLFPKNYEVKEEVLADHWIAHGFVLSESPGQSLEETARRYFHNLVSMSFFQISEEGFYYKMHDLIHDLALVVAGKKCATLSAGSGSVDPRTRHVSLDFDPRSTSTWKIDPRLMLKATKIRSILMPTRSSYYAGYRRLDQSFCDAIVSKFKFLRSLDLHDSGIEKVPSSIDKLKHLRCLDVSSNVKLKKLPNSVSRLVNLQALNIGSCRSFRELPRGISKLVNLRNLRLEQCCSLTHMPRGIGQLTNLRTLSRFVLSKDRNRSRKGKLDELRTLNNLKGELEISNLQHGIELKAEIFAEKRHLRSLKLVWNPDPDPDATMDEETILEGIESLPNLEKLWVESYRGIGFPSLSSVFSGISELSLINCKNCRYLPPLYLCQSLKKLELQSMPVLKYVTETFGSSTALMRSLKIVALKDLPELQGWWKEGVIEPMRPCFDRLDELIVSDCPKLTSMPLFPSVIDWLVLKNCSWKPFEQTMARLECSPLSGLSHLVVRTNKDILSLPDWLNGLSSLKLLKICDCPKLTSLCPGIQHLGSLTQLEICECQELDILDDDVWRSLSRLTVLKLLGLRKLVNLPESLQQVASLKYLFVGLCARFEALPGWIRGLGLLRRIYVWECPEFRSLPRGMSVNVSLLQVDVVGFSMLRQRLGIELSEDSWSKNCLFVAVTLSPVNSQSPTYSGISWVEDDQGFFKPKLLKN